MKNLNAYKKIFNNMGEYKIILLPQNMNHISDMCARKEGIRVWRNAGGNLHREDGPAVIFPDGTLHWYINGGFHREDGPAVIDIKSGIFWYWYGYHCEFDEWCKHAQKSDEESVFLKIQFGAWNGCRNE